MIPLLIGGILLLIAMGGGDSKKADPAPTHKPDPRKDVLDQEIDREKIKRGEPVTPAGHSDPGTPSHASAAWGPDDPIPQGAPLGNIAGWAKYLSLSIIAPQNNDDGASLGMFKATPTTLEEDGFMKAGKWIAPFSKARFLASRRDQYEAFVRQAKRHAAAVQSRAGKTIGTMVKGAKPGTRHTLSGLMGVARVLGLAGLDRWINGTQKAYKADADAAFLKLNGLF